MNGYQIKPPLIFIFVLFLTSGCSSLQPLDTRLSTQEAIQGIDIGDQIEIETKSGERRLINVSSISETHIEAGNEQFALEEIEIIAHRKPTATEKAAGVTAAAVVGVTKSLFEDVLIVLLVLLVAL